MCVIEKRKTGEQCPSKWPGFSLWLEFEKDKVLMDFQGSWLVFLSLKKKKKRQACRGNKAAWTLSIGYARIKAIYLNPSEGEGFSYNM